MISMLDQKTFSRVANYQTLLKIILLKNLAAITSRAMEVVAGLQGS